MTLLSRFLVQMKPNIATCHDEALSCLSLSSASALKHWETWFKQYGVWLGCGEKHREATKEVRLHSWYRILSKCLLCSLPSLALFFFFLLNGELTQSTIWWVWVFFKFVPVARCKTLSFQPALLQLHKFLPVDSLRCCLQLWLIKTLVWQGAHSFASMNSASS